MPALTPWIGKLLRHHHRTQHSPVRLNLHRLNRCITRPPPMMEYPSPSIYVHRHPRTRTSQVPLALHLVNHDNMFGHKSPVHPSPHIQLSHTMGHLRSALLTHTPRGTFCTPPITRPILRPLRIKRSTKPSFLQVSTSCRNPLSLKDARGRLHGAGLDPSMLPSSFTGRAEGSHSVLTS